MRKEILIVFMAMALGLGASQYYIEKRQQEPVQRVAWWSMMYERPNPERLPVRVHFRWLKGLE